MKKYLVLGGTGAMGVHLCSLLAEEDALVVVTTRRSIATDKLNIAYARGDAKDPSFLMPLVEGCRWSAIFDFMVWDTDEFADKMELFLNHTDQYFFTSSYRVYSESFPITEDAPRLLDSINDAEYLSTDEYALRKARCENCLFQSGQNNWTIVRPAITYDRSGRFQLGVYEAIEWLPRAFQGVPIPFPEEMLSKRTTMSWGGDVAKMISMLVGNEQAFGEAFTVSTAESATWREVCSFYSASVPLKATPCHTLDFDRLYPKRRYQIHYDRMFDRVIDNSKVLKATGLAQSDFVSMEEGLSRELASYINEGEFKTGCQDIRPGMQGRFDRLTGGYPAAGWIARNCGLTGLIQYVIRRCLYSPAN